MYLGCFRKSVFRGGWGFFHKKTCSEKWFLDYLGIFTGRQQPASIKKSIIALPRHEKFRSFMGGRSLVALMLCGRISGFAFHASFFKCTSFTKFEPNYSVFSPILGSKVKKFRLRRARKVKFFICGSKKQNFSPAARSKGKSFFPAAGSERKIFRLWRARKAKFPPVAAEEANFFTCDRLRKHNFRLRRAQMVKILPAAGSESKILACGKLKRQICLPRLTQKAKIFACGALRKQICSPAVSSRGNNFRL